MARQQMTPHTQTDVDELMKMLADVRVNGYAVCDEELELGVRSIAVPIQDAGGVVVASMSIVASTRRRSLDNVLGSLLPELESARRMVGAML
jgi:IclR family pca regulon transcriptional regulator